ncbi:hypothetical protein GCM10022254_31990 [Actinomadura meridiana]|uniref:Uncharacterized protein n=1 Tax=Actinomadura meridiana TaxID=559626 RepID=A0ABP8C290_9ACTN
MPSDSFIAMFDGHVRRTPGATALVWDGHGVTYAQLAESAAALSSDLSRHGLPSGADPAGSEPSGAGSSGAVAVRADKSPRTIALVIACLGGGRPVLLLSPELGAATVRELVARSGIRHLLNVERDDGLTVVEIDPVPDAPAIPAGTGLLLTTSGSTGLPKVVPLPMAGVAAFMAWAVDRFGIGPGTRVLNYAPLNFDLCLLDVWATLAAGGCAVLVDPERATDGEHVARLIADNGVHVVQGVPLMYRQLRAVADDDLVGPLKDPRHVVFTGEAMPPALLATLPDLFPRAAFHNVYGCTETNDSFVHEADLVGWDERRPLPIGRPIPGVRALVTAEDGRTVHGPGTGELVVHTPFQTTGYLDARLGRDAFVPRDDPDGTRVYYRTGDLVRRDADGTLVLVGRRDFQVKVRGTRVNPQEIERVLLAHPQVAEAAVVACPDDLAGNRLHAFVRRVPGGAVNGLGLRGHCADRLPRVAIPSEIRFVDGPLPRGATGKVDRAACARMVARPR